MNYLHNESYIWKERTSIMIYWSQTAHLNRKTAVSHTHLIVLPLYMLIINDLFPEKHWVFLKQKESLFYSSEKDIVLFTVSLVMAMLHFFFQSWPFLFSHGIIHSFSGAHIVSFEGAFSLEFNYYIDNGHHQSVRQ